MGETMIRGLVVEDDADVAELLSRILRGRSLDVAVAHTAETAKAMLATSSFSIALLDLHLPDLGGLGLIEHIETQYPELARRALIVTGFPTIARAFSTSIPIVPKGDLDTLRVAIDGVLAR